MIIFRYLQKEVAKTQLAVFFVLMTIFISRKFVAVLGDASEGGIPGQLVMVFIGLKVPYLAGMLLPLSLFLGILLAYGRIYSESEMTVLHACGVSEWYVVRVTLVLGIITALLTGLFTFYLSPLASKYESQIKEKLASDAGLSSLVAGRFQKTGNKKAVVFIHEKERKNNILHKVFVAQLPAENTIDDIINSSIVYAANGQVIEEENGSQRLVLEKGNRYQRDATNHEFRSVAFDKYYIQIEDKKIEHQRLKISAMPTTALMNKSGAEFQTELQWRLAFPLAAFILVFLAVPLSVVNPRQGKFAKMFPALMLFLAYFLLLTSVRSGMEKGSVSPLVGLWPVHLIVFLFGLTLLVKDRSSGLKIKAFLPKLVPFGASR